MPQYTCPHCQKPFTAPATASPAQVLCPHCQQAVEVPATTASRWFLGRAKKKFGPYTLAQLLALAQKGSVQQDDLVLQEGAKQWVRADSVPTLREHMAPAPTKQSPPPVETPIVAEKPASRRSTTWLIIGVTAAGVGMVLALGLVVAFLWPRDETPVPPKLANQDRVKDDRKKTDSQPPKTDSSIPKNEKEPTKKDPGPEEKKKPIVPKSTDDGSKFVAQLNRLRKSAGLGVIALDPELTRGCKEHANYLAQNVDPAKPIGPTAFEQDPKKPGYSVEGERAGRNALFSLHESLAALERWMGRLSSRTLLLNPELQSIGIGVLQNERGDWYCVVDAVRGRGDQVIVYPAANQTDVPISFSGGPDVPDAKSAAGFPISVSFPPAKQVTAAQVTLSEGKSKTLDGWLWTPEKPPRPGQKLNAVGFIPKALLQSNTLYEVKASARVDGKPWSLDWSFTTDDDADGKGVWAKKALDKVNQFRIGAGLKPVTLDDKLSMGCLKHARYLVINEGHPSLGGLNAHNEDLKLPGASPEGNKAGNQSNIGIGDFEPIDAVDSWMATLYHRVPILAPNLRSIGFACVRGRRQGWATVMNVQGGLEKTGTHAVFYPAPDQTNVPLSFPNGGEEPNPLPDDPDGRAGYPITASFPFKEPLLNATGKLTNEKGDEVASWFSSPENPANKKHAKAQGATICLIAKDPLLPRATYHVQLKGTLAGKTWEKKWKFTTCEVGSSAEMATRSVVDRLNHYRVRAGLHEVTLDDSLARGCQLHAEYLAKNADVLMKTKSSVNDEDPELPWFTAEGLRSARQSFVFSNAPIPVMQIDDLMATFTSRVVVLDPTLNRVGFGAAHDVGRGWRCVLDPNGGRGDGRIVVYPAPKQEDTPLLGFDRIDQAKGQLGFPISVMFPQRAVVGAVQASLLDSNKQSVEHFLSTPKKPLYDKQQRNAIGVHPLAPLQAGHTYSVTISAIVNGKEWRQNWQFTTGK